MSLYRNHIRQLVRFKPRIVAEEQERRRENVKIVKVVVNEGFELRNEISTLRVASAHLSQELRKMERDRVRLVREIAQNRETLAKQEKQFQRSFMQQQVTQSAGSLWPSVPTESYPVMLRGENMPATSGIYFFWENGCVIYVGQSTNLKNRVRVSHDKIVGHGLGGILVSYVLIDVDNLTFAECFYIGSLRPRLNRGTPA